MKNINTLLVLAIFILISGVSAMAQSTPPPAPENAKLIPGFTNESKIGIVATTGNSKSQTYDLSQKDTYEWASSKAAGFGNYLRSTSRGTESARRWSTGLRYDYKLSERWALFLAQNIEGDKYAGYFQRYNSDAGAKFLIVKDETNNWGSEAGYRFQHENQTTGATKNSSFSRLFTEYEHQWSPTFSTKLWVEYLQSFQLWKDKFVNTEFSSKAMINQVFSIQLSYLVRYRNFPPEGVAYKTDTTLTTALLAQF